MTTDRAAVEKKQAVSAADLAVLPKQAGQRGISIRFRVRYYETDAMGIVHHSNYIRWFELGRTEYLRAVSLAYRSLEDRGIGSPVIGIRCRYLHPSRYDDLIELETWVQAYDGIRLTMGYAARCANKLICSGESDHAFVRDGRAVAPVRSLPEVHRVLTACLTEDQSAAGC